ncbi:MAG: hypothetical protein IPH20_07550 [Bacteroidales bacterium]|nr:hypothetical protein [Bacteroidales bacterium]
MRLLTMFLVVACSFHFNAIYAQTIPPAGMNSNLLKSPQEVFKHTYTG